MAKAVTSSVVVQREHSQRDGRFRVLCRYTFSDGTDTEAWTLVEADTDLEQFMAQQAAGFDQEFRDAEEEPQVDP